MMHRGEVTYAAMAKAFPDTLVAYAVSEDGRTIGGPELVAIDANDNGLDVRLVHPIVVAEGGNVFLRVYGGDGVLAFDTEYPTYVRPGGTIASRA